MLPLLKRTIYSERKKNIPEVSFCQEGEKASKKFGAFAYELMD